MTLDEKIGQMVQVDSNALHDKADVKKYFLGSVLSGGDSAPRGKLPHAWPANNEQLSADHMNGTPLFPVGFGLTYYELSRN
jgi:beta-glucosidase